MMISSMDAHSSHSKLTRVNFGVVVASQVICSNVSVIAGSFGSSTAACAPPTNTVAGAHPITAIFTNNDGNFSDSTSSVLLEVVQSMPNSSTILGSGPNPSVVGLPVTHIATVSSTPPLPLGPTPTGSVTFWEGTPIASHTVIGTETLKSKGKATLTTSALPAGSDNLFAVYNGDTRFGSSTSPVIVQVVLALPGSCSDKYVNMFYGTPGSPVGNNFVWIPNGSFQVYGANGNNCFWGGDGNDVNSAGNGHDIVISGNGNNSISLKDGSDVVHVGNGTNEINLGGGERHGHNRKWQ